MYFLALPSLLHPLISLLFILVHDVLLFLSSNQFLHAMYKTLGALYGTSYTFQCCTQKSGWRVRGEATLTLRAGDEANILAQQCCSRLNGSQQQQPWCIVLSNSALQYWHQINLHSSYPQILGDISLLQTSWRTMMQTLAQDWSTLSSIHAWCCHSKLLTGSKHCMHACLASYELS